MYLSLAGTSSNISTSDNISLQVYNILYISSGLFVFFLTSEFQSLSYLFHVKKIHVQIFCKNIFLGIVIFLY